MSPYRVEYPTAASLLFPVGSTNQSKSDRGPSEWMPPNADYGCAYAARFVDVLTAYQLTVNPADYSTLRAQLASCAA